MATIPVTEFSAMARAEFMQGMLAVQEELMPSSVEPFTTKIGSTSRFETHTFMSSVPQLREFKGYSPGTRLVSTPYRVENKTYRAGPVAVNKEDLDDEKAGGYLMSIKALPTIAQNHIQYKVLEKLAAGTADLCFDDSAFFANSHTIGSGDNLITVDNAGNDGVTHKMVGLVLTNPAFKPLLFQEREPLSGLQDDTRDALSDKIREYEYWADCRIGFGYGFWWDGVHLTITDTPTLTEAQDHLEDIVDQFRTFTFPVGQDVDTARYVHEAWVPESSNFYIFCNMKMAEILRTIQKESLIAAGTSGATITNKWRDSFTLVPTGALGA